MCPLVLNKPVNKYHLCVRNSYRIQNFQSMPTGITYKRTATGKPVSVPLILKKYSSEIEDFPDKVEMDTHRNKPTKPLEKVIARVDKKYCIKRK